MTPSAGDFDAANIAYRQVLDDSSAPVADTKTALLGLAHMHRKQGELTKAAAIYEKFLKEYPGDDRYPTRCSSWGGFARWARTRRR